MAVPVKNHGINENVVLTLAAFTDLGTTGPQFSSSDHYLDYLKYHCITAIYWTLFRIQFATQ